MDWTHHVLRALADPFRYPVDITERIFVGYLGSALVLAVFVFVYLRRHLPDSMPSSPLAYLFPKRIYLHKSAIADYEFFLIDRILFALLLPSILVLMPPMGDVTQNALDSAFGPVAHPWNRAGVGVLIVATLAQVVMTDFILFYWHYLFHKVPFLWEFHKVHHSAEVMTPMTAYRMHPVELISSLFITAFASGALFGIFGHLTGGGRPEFTIYGVNAVMFVFFIFGFNLRHSHVPLGYGRVLSQVFVSPWMHQVHHSCETRHLDRNMGFVFSFWDRMFGTLYLPELGEEYKLGLTTGEHVHFHSVPALYFRPFANLLRRLIKPKPVKVA